MKTIPLTNSPLEAYIDDDLYDFCMSKTWLLHHSGEVQSTDSLHTPMQYFVVGKPDNGLEVDHKDRVKRNNQRNNLRFATRSQNTANRGRFKNNTTGYIGVTFLYRTEKYQGYVDKDKKRYYTGCFDTAIKAAQARDRKAAELHGEYASLNFPL